jgi:uncharacterized integral membrane protein
MTGESLSTLGTTIRRAPIKPVNVFMWVVAALVIAFVMINWGMLVTPIQVSFGFTRVSTPLGLVLLSLTAALTAAFVGLLLSTTLDRVARTARTGRQGGGVTLH